MYLQKVKRKKKIRWYLEATDKKRRVQIRLAGICGSGSVPKCQGSTILLLDNYLGSVSNVFLWSIGLPDSDKY